MNLAESEMRTGAGRPLLTFGNLAQEERLRLSSVVSMLGPGTIVGAGGNLAQHGERHRHTYDLSSVHGERHRHTYDLSSVVSMLMSQLEAERRINLNICLTTSSTTVVGQDRKGPQNEPLRSNLVDHLLHVCKAFRLGSFCGACQLFDYCLTTMPVMRSQILLCGMSCLLVASKLTDTEHSTPTAKALVQMCSKSCSAFDLEELLAWERHVIRALSFSPEIPSRTTFALLFGRISELDSKEQALSLYFCESSLFDAVFSAYPSSMVAAAATHLSLQMLRHRIAGSVPKEQLWSDTSSLRLCSGYAEAQLVPLVLRLRVFNEQFDHPRLLRPTFVSLCESDLCWSTGEAENIAVELMSRAKMTLSNGETRDELPEIQAGVNTDSHNETPPELKDLQSGFGGPRHSSVLTGELRAINLNGI